ncbi:MAG: hypothetical protein HZC24_15155 [Rhodocyclales bacterium]|nr:hypothetical protein [Rhodocyclales bacterium]
MGFHDGLRSRCLHLGVVLSVVALALLAEVCAAQTNARSPLGINLRELRYWNTEMPTVDFFKRASSGAGSVWLTQCNWGPSCQDASGNDIHWNTSEQAQLDLDAAGWPKSLPAAGSALKYRFVTTLLWWQSDKIPLGRWTVLYDGEGTLAYGQTGVTRNAAASTAGRDAVDVVSGANALTLSITATDPNGSGNYLRNIRVIPPGGTCNNDPFSYAADASVCPSSYRPLTETYASQPFHPQFLAAMRPFAGFRVIHLMMTNNDLNTQWSERPQFSDISWGYDANKGVPAEVALDLANALDTSPWLEMPAMASDDYVLQFARLAKARLTTARPIYLEYGNEIWNSAWPYSIGGNWVKEQGKARWSASTASDYEKMMNWFGLRTKQICAIWKQEFADRPGQVKCVMGSQGAQSWVTDHYILSCPLHAAEPGGTACNATAGIDAVAGGYYFGGHVADAMYQSQIEAEWLTEADGGLTKLFQELTDGSLLRQPAGSNRAQPNVALIATQMAANKLVAVAHGVDMVVYEGGNELFGRDSSAYQVQLQTLFERAQRDARMGALYTAVLNHWKAHGGHLYAIYESTGKYSFSRGNSPLLEWQGQTRAESPKYDAVVGFIENNPCWWAGCAAGANAVLVPGWNLVGNGFDAPLTVATRFGDAARIRSVWKWLTSGSAPGISYPTWAFYSPALADGGQAYAAGKGYELLASIGAGEGFWVNARTAFALPLPAGAPVASTSFVPAIVNPPIAGGAHALPRGWSLIAAGDQPSPVAFDAAIATVLAAPPAVGQAYGNLTSLWAWDATRSVWYFWAPSLVNSGGLASYLASKGSLDFAALPTTPAGTLPPTTGLWVNMP